jgi:HSP20 family protein
MNTAHESSLARAPQKDAHERADADSMMRSVVLEPLVDIYESRDEILLVADFPGVPKEALTVRLDRSDLVLEGAQPERDEDSAPRPVMFSRTFRVPSTVEAGGVSAELSGGVLRVHLAKSESAKPRRIPVRSA